LDLTSRDLLNRPEPDARFDQLPDSINEARELNTLKDDLTDHLYHNSSLKLLYSSTLKTYSQPNETERDFRMRLSQSAREKRDEEVDKLNQSYETRLRTLQDRLRRAQTAVAMRQADAEARKREVVVSAGESVLGMFLGRRSMRSASTALSKYRQKTAAEMRAQEAADSVETLQKDIDQLEGELRQETTAITARWDDATKAFDEVPVRPARSDIEVETVAVAWAPNWQLVYHDRQGNVRTELLRAY
jgi:TolA-binding protein